MYANGTPAYYHMLTSSPKYVSSLEESGMAEPDRSLMSCGLRSMKDVVAVPDRNSGCRSTFSRNPMSADDGTVLLCSSGS